MNGSTIDHHDALWPRAARQMKGRRLARRLATMEGKTVAQLWDYLFRGDEVFALLEEGLRSRFPGVKFIGWREIGNTHGSDERKVIAALPQRLKEMKVDAVISAMAA